MSNVTRTLVLAAVAALVLQTAAPALSQSPATVGPGSPSSAAPARELAGSLVLAGYGGPGGDDSLQAMFTVRPFECAADETSSMLVGVLAYLTDEGGQSFVNGGGGVFYGCAAGVKSLRSALYDPTGRAAEAGPVAVGDKLRVTYDADVSTLTASSTLENLTQDFVTITGPFEYVRTTDFQAGNLALTSDGTRGGPVPGVSRMTLRPVRVDGQKIKDKSPLTRYRLVDAEGIVIRTASQIEKGGFWVKPVKVDQPPGAAALP